jgi:nickel/cobalt transporter (NicO) family protein
MAMTSYLDDFDVDAARFAETQSGYGVLAMRGIEVGAAVVIIAFGTLLLAGYVVTERMVAI